MATAPTVPVAPVMVWAAVSTPTVAATPLTISASEPVEPLPETAMLPRPVGVLGLLRLKVSELARPAIASWVLSVKLIGSRLSTLTRPRGRVGIAEPGDRSIQEVRRLLVRGRRRPVEEPVDAAAGREVI